MTEVRLTGGVVRGRIEDGVAVFRGVPFAQPPIGALRLAAPAPVAPWHGVREAIAFGRPPPQSRVMGGAAERDDDGDWLTANVWTPGGRGLPVMVWIHGGGYVVGRSDDPTFDGALLAGGGVVVVTFNHRLGAEGFGRFSGAPANRGLLDQLAALRWVRDNAAAFGGDPSRVTVFGESAGAGCIAALMAMPGARGLFRRAIAQSVPGLVFTDALAAEVAAEVAGRLGVGVDARQIASRSPSALRDAADEVAEQMGATARWGAAAHLRTPFAPVVDGEVLPAAPWHAVADGAGSEVELIVGHTRDEYRLFLAIHGLLGSVDAARTDAALRVLAPSIQAPYAGSAPERRYELLHSDWLFRMPSLRLAEAHARRGPTWLYELCWSPGALGACHGLGVPLTFGTLTAGTASLLIGPPSAEAARLSAAVRAAWTAFARTGDPGWPAYDGDAQRTWVVDGSPEVRSYPEQGSRALWAAHPFAPLDVARP